MPVPVPIVVPYSGAAPPASPVVPVQPQALFDPDSPYSFETSGPPRPSVGRGSNAAVLARARRKRAYIFAGLGVATVVLSLLAGLLVAVQVYNVDLKEVFQGGGMSAAASAALKQKGKKSGPDADAEKAGKTKDAADPDDRKWLDASSDSYQYDKEKIKFQVRVESVNRGRPPLANERASAADPSQEYLLVALEIKNSSADKIVEYRGFVACSGGSREMILTDDIGNTYRPVGCPPGAVKDQVATTVSIYPKESVRDLAVFQRMVDKAESLRLEVSLGLFGQTGPPAAFEIPHKMIGRATDLPTFRPTATGKQGAGAVPPLGIGPGTPTGFGPASPTGVGPAQPAGVGPGQGLPVGRPAGAGVANPGVGGPDAPGPIELNPGEPKPGAPAQDDPFSQNAGKKSATGDEKDAKEVKAEQDFDKMFDGGPGKEPKVLKDKPGKKHPPARKPLSAGDKKQESAF